MTIHKIIKKISFQGLKEKSKMGSLVFKYMYQLATLFSGAIKFDTFAPHYVHIHNVFNCSLATNYN
jgi:hypothetical protein